MKRTSILLLLLLAACGGDVSSPADEWIASRQPGSGADDVSVATAVRITFARAVELPVDTANAVWLERGGTRVPAALTRPDSRTVVLTPLDVLEAGAAHTVQVGGGITDPEGVIPASNWQFTTAGRVIAGLAGDRLLDHVRALAHDSMRGRGAGTPEELEAANHIRGEFARYGLSAYSGGQWLQTVPPEGFTGNSQNVIGVLRGTGSLRDEWLVIGAHYDHVGVRDGVIYNGADDNASGTAGLLELARALAQHEAADGFGSSDRRSIMFIAFGAEERGLIGSYHYCRNPLVSLGRVSAMLNLDMIGRLRGNTLYVAGAQTAGEWLALLGRYDPALAIVPIGTIGTDYRCFMQAGRPAIALYTGTHPDYHQPTDDAELIDVPGITAVSNLALRVAVNLAVRPRPLTQ